MSEQPHFDISAAVVRQLGEELVSDEVTALIELVKNAYDADATYANVVVDTNHVLTPEESFFPGTSGSITIEDDGIGMDRSDINRGWLTISLSSKRRMKEEGRQTPKGRTPLGDKGLGRLSTQRLGNQLDMFTYKEESGCAYHVAFNWNDFREDLPLSIVPVHFVERIDSGRHKGTKLVISDLRDPAVWRGQARNELIRRLSQLIFPFGEYRSFRIYLMIDGQRIPLETIAESVRDAAVARFNIDYVAGKLAVTGRIRLIRLRTLGDESEEAYQRLLADDYGRKFFAFLTSSENRFTFPNATYVGDDGWFISFTEARELARLTGRSYIERQDADGVSTAGVGMREAPQERQPILAEPGGFHAEVDEFALRGTDLNTLDSVFDRNSEFSQFIKNQSGVRIFRDGFGIRPYGLDGNDWLGLGSGQTSGRSFYGLRPQNVIGYVALSEENNRQLREKTDREGFITSPFSANFFLLMNEAVRIISLGYNSLRRSYNEYKRSHAQEVSGFRSITAPMTEMREASTAVATLEQQARNLDQRLDDVTQSVRTVTNRVDNEPLFATPNELQLTSLLKSVDSTLAQARALVGELQSLMPKAKRLSEIADYLEPQIAALETQLEEFSELAGLGLTAEALSHEIHTVSDRLAAQTRTVIDISKRQALQPHELTTYTEYVMSAVSTLRKQLSHLAPSLRYVREQRENIALRPFIEEVREFYSARFQNAGIRSVIGEPFENFALHVNRGRLTQIIDNLVLNADYWIKEASRSGMVTDPEIRFSAQKPYLRIADNGLGIDPAVERTLFQPFVTMKPPGQGRGLGLFIAQQLLDSIGGSISVLPERNVHGRRYIFQLDFSGVLYGG